MDDRGVARGKCTEPGCSCLQYQRQGRVKRCPCGHVPTKHASVDPPGIAHHEDADLDSQLEQCISLDHTQPAPVAVSDSVQSSDSAPVLPAQAWSTSNMTEPLTAGMHLVVLSLGVLQNHLPIIFLHSSLLIIQLSYSL